LNGICDPKEGVCKCYQDKTLGFWSGTLCDKCWNGTYVGNGCDILIGNGQFSDNGRYITIPYERLGTPSPTYLDCKQVFGESLKFFGSNPKCNWIGKYFEVTLDSDAWFAPNSLINVNTYPFERNLNSIYSIKVLPPLNPLRPTVSLTGPLLITSCDQTIYLDASLSSSFDGRPLSFNYSIKSTNSEIPQTLKNEIASANQKIAKFNVQTLLNGTYEFSVNVTTYFSAFEVKTLSIKKIQVISFFLTS
jgi:hypothetical protein